MEVLEIINRVANRSRKSNSLTVSSGRNNKKEWKWLKMEIMLYGSVQYIMKKR